MSEKTMVWAAKHALIDMTMFGAYDVSDKVGVAQWIEKLPDNRVLEVFDMMCLDGNSYDKKCFLEESYHSDLTPVSEDTVVINESKWSDARNSILMEADGDSKIPAANDINKILKTGTVSAAALYIVHTAASKGPAEADRQLLAAAAFGISRYEQIRKNVIELMKRMHIPESVQNAMPTLHNTSKHMTAKYRWLSDEKMGAKRTQAQMDKVNAHGERMANLDLSKSKENLKKFLKVPGYIAAGVLTATAIGGLLYLAYQKYASAAAVSCRGQKTSKDKSICVLRFKIKACEETIKKATDGLSGCPKNKNPEQCTHAMTSNIWNFKRRKAKLEQELAKLVGQATSTKKDKNSDIFG